MGTEIWVSTRRTFVSLARGASACTFWGGGPAGKQNLSLNHSSQTEPDDPPGVFLHSCPPSHHYKPSRTCRCSSRPPPWFTWSWCVWGVWCSPNLALSLSSIFDSPAPVSSHIGHTHVISGSKLQRWSFSEQMNEATYCRSAVGEPFTWKVL